MTLMVCVVVLALLPSMSQAKENTRSFANFSIAVPSTWSVHTEASVTTITHPRQICALSIMAVPHQDVVFRELGIAFYQNLQGKSPKGDDDGMTFDLITANNMPSTTRLTEVGELFVAVSAIGQCLPHVRILRSITILGADGKPHPYAVRVYPYLQGERTLPSSAQSTQKKADSAKADAAP